MEQTKSAREILAQIEKKYFRGASLDKASRTEGDERRAYRLAQVERLLTEKSGNVPYAMFLSDEFWTADEGRVQYEKYPSPLLSLAEQQTLTDGEMRRLRLILEIAGLCHDLSLHFMFGLEAAFGVEDDFWVSNAELVAWLTTTEYEQIAMHTAYIMKKHAISAYADRHYLPAQDELAELFSSEYHKLVRQPIDTEMPPRAYVRTIINALLAIDQHWQQGQSMGLSPDIIILHDEIYGVMPRQFDEGVLQVARELYDFMDREVYENPSAEVLGRFADKVRELRSKYLAEGWIADDSLEFAYLMEHAQRCSQGWWREEDEAL